jgi:HK97 family phage portal protein
MFEWLFKSKTGDISNVLEIIATDLTKVQLAVMAQEKAACMIAKAIAKSEIVLTKGEERRKDEEYYRLNIRPNDNETATDFWFNVARELVSTGDCVVVRMANGKYYRANSYQMDDYVLFGKTYSNITITDGYNEVTLRYGVNSDDVLHFRFGTEKLRVFTKNVLGCLDDALDAVRSLETIANTPLLKYKVDANLQFRRRTTDGKEVRLTLDNVLDEFKAKIDGKKLAIITEQTGSSLEFMDVKKQVSAAEVTALADTINKECAAAYDIPLGVFNGQITEQSDATNEFITYAVSPVAEVINDTLNAKLVGQADYVAGERAFVWLAHFKHIDVIDAANSLDKLRAIGFTLDEIFEMVGYPALNTDFSTKRALTKNYATEGLEESAQPTGGADDLSEESVRDSNRKQSKHKERRERRNVQNSE